MCGLNWHSAVISSSRPSSICSLSEMVIGASRPTSPPPSPLRPRTLSITTAPLTRATSTRTWPPHTSPASPTSTPTQPLLLWAPPAPWPTWWRHRAQRATQSSTVATHRASSTRSRSAWATACCLRPPCTTASTRPSLPTRPTSALRLPPLSTLDTRWAPPRSTSTLTSREDTGEPEPAPLLPRTLPPWTPSTPETSSPRPQTWTETEEHAILMKLSRITWRYNDREKRRRKKNSQPL